MIHISLCRLSLALAFYVEDGIHVGVLASEHGGKLIMMPRN